ncbi:hypothetical protein [Dongia sp.]|uniref:hypothetical protein n=1 Tax=Dongia sp. TaxID=1977262 RepID=UPI0035B24958
MTKSDTPPSFVEKLLRAWRRARCIVLPYKNAVSIDGKWHPVVPVEAGPPIAELDGEAIPQWWVLDCGRIVEFVGVHDALAANYNLPPTQPGETIIGSAIYRVAGQS